MSASLRDPLEAHWAAWFRARYGRQKRCRLQIPWSPSSSSTMPSVRPRRASNTNCRPRATRLWLRPASKQAGRAGTEHADAPGLGPIDGTLPGQSTQPQRGFGGEGFAQQDPQGLRQAYRHPWRWGAPCRLRAPEAGVQAQASPQQRSNQRAARGLPASAVTPRPIRCDQASLPSRATRRPLQETWPSPAIAAWTW